MFINAILVENYSMAHMILGALPLFVGYIILHYQTYTIVVLNEINLKLFVAQG